MTAPVEPLGSYARRLPPGAGLVAVAVAIVLGAGLFELSRTLAEVARGRWYAGNGRDVFHAAAVAVLGAAYFLNGLPPALAFLTAAVVSIDPIASGPFGSPSSRAASTASRDRAVIRCA